MAADHAVRSRRRVRRAGHPPPPQPEAKCLMSNESTSTASLVERIHDSEAQLTRPRSIRAQQIVDSYRQGVSIHRLAKDRSPSDNTVTRVVTDSTLLSRAFW